jgi:hypothetical protein
MASDRGNDGLYGGYGRSGVDDLERTRWAAIQPVASQPTNQSCCCRLHFESVSLLVDMTVHLLDTPSMISSLYFY